jgi:hypothetical protein
MKMLIRTEIINGNYKVAARYTGILKKTFFYRKEAERLEKLLFNESAINADPELGQKRREKIVTDFFAITDDPYINVGRILSRDSLNRKAFDYKIAFMMLRKDYQGIAAALPEFQKFGYQAFPVHVEEAAVAFSVLNNGQIPATGNLRISENTAARWNQFLTVFQQYGTNARAAEPALRKQFGNTFWYWAFYR